MGWFKSVLFDMDGVIVDSMRHHADAWIEVLNRYGLGIGRMDIYLREGMSGRDSVIDIFREKGSAYPGDDELNIMIEQKLAIFERHSIGLYPRTGEILNCLKKRGIALALVTGSLRRSVDKLLSPDIANMFRAIVTSDDVANGKPHPEPYSTALGLLGGDAGTAVVIENAPLGIQSALNAGIECFALETSLPGNYLAGASKIFRDHLSLLEYFHEELN